mmetsp:Transcript_20931/g.50405  ORF Transcript_20931/g.50405 Transcript_20931/m.50405 type:complete len:402 (+) Transcript_20931:185-1390(+)
MHAVRAREARPRGPPQIVEGIARDDRGRAREGHELGRRGLPEEQEGIPHVGQGPSVPLRNDLRQAGADDADVGGGGGAGLSLAPGIPGLGRGGEGRHAEAASAPVPASPALAAAPVGQIGHGGGHTRDALSGQPPIPVTAVGGSPRVSNVRNIREGSREVRTVRRGHRAGPGGRARESSIRQNGHDPYHTPTAKKHGGHRIQFHIGGRARPGKHRGYRDPSRHHPGGGRGTWSAGARGRGRRIPRLGGQRRFGGGPSTGASRTARQDCGSGEESVRGAVFEEFEGIRGELEQRAGSRRSGGRGLDYGWGECGVAGGVGGDGRGVRHARGRGTPDAGGHDAGCRVEGGHCRERIAWELRRQRVESRVPGRGTEVRNFEGGLHQHSAELYGFHRPCFVGTPSF